MGRSQVERNRIKGRPGGRGGGRGRGSGGGGGRGGRSSRRSGPDPKTLGDNAFRYERTNRSKDAVIDDDNNDMLLDDFNTGLLLGSDYYGASHYELHDDDDNAPSSFQNGDSDWMAVDVQAMTACFKQLPLHERLDIPYHVGKHIESRYGNDNAAGGKKTLAELREESKCKVNNETGDGDVDTKQDSPAERKETKDDKSDDDEDDLDAWLDDMIS